MFEHLLKTVSPADIDRAGPYMIKELNTIYNKLLH